MRFSYPLRMSVIKRGDKEQKLAAFVSSYFSEIRACWRHTSSS
jgi:hypothetical protein